MPGSKPLKSTFLEASAGTGKTYTIEKWFVRLLSEPQAPQIPEILVLTFTRAATLELKQRIYAAIAADNHLKKELALFDEASIFTIHAFCYHCLTEFSLLANLSLDHKEESASTRVAKELVQDFLLGTSELNSYEMEQILKYPFIDTLIDLSAKRVPIVGGRPFPKIYAEFKARLGTFHIPFADALHDLLLYAPCFAGMSKLKPDLVKEIERFATLFKEGVTEKTFPFSTPLLDMREEHRLKRAKWPEAKDEKCPGLFQKIQTDLIPLIQESTNALGIFAHVATSFQKSVDQVREQEELFFYEDLLCEMEKRIKDPVFAASIRSRYKAVFIDEFQDTDKRQWRILEHLFGKKEFHGPLFLIGDPKQSIYRFRHSDLYTFFEAKKTFQEDEISSLETNYRSRSSLVEGLNALFTPMENFLTLPKSKVGFRCPKVYPKSPCETGDKALHFFEGESEEALFSFVLQKSEHYPLSHSAILVKDRFQAKRFLEYCKREHFPAVSKRCRTVHDTHSLEVFYQFLDGVIHSKNRSKVAIALASPLFGSSFDEDNFLLFQKYHAILKEKGVLFLLNEMTCEKELYNDLLHLGSMMQKDGASFYSYLSYLEELKKEPEESERAKLYFVNTSEALQVLTIHASKGLEFEVVFPLGLVLDTESKRETVFDPEKEVLTFSEEAFQLHVEELKAEKMRLLYVAMTRAKKELFVPILKSKKYPTSPMNLFLRERFKESTLEDFVKACPYATFEIAQEKHLLWNKMEKEEELERQERPLLNFKPQIISSFSSLILPHRESLQEKSTDLPSGKEFGHFIHTLLEKVFPESLSLLPSLLEKSPYAAWKEKIEEMVMESLTLPLPFTLLSLDPQKIMTEMEFLYLDGENYVKGFIDLVFEHEGRMYFLDWKTNDLGKEYSEESLQRAMEENGYFLQAKIYEEALRRTIGEEIPFGGYYYLFLRGPACFKR